MSKMFHGEQSGGVLVVLYPSGSFDPVSRALSVKFAMSNGQTVSKAVKPDYPDAYFLTGRGGNSVAITRIQAEELVPGISKGREGGA